MIKLIDGLGYAKSLKELIQLEINEHLSVACPGLAIVQVADNPASQVYVAAKIKQAKELGIDARHYHLNESTTESHIIELINHLNQESKVHGIIVQLPLPSHIDSNKIVDRILPIKDVDGLSTTNVGHLSKGMESNIPCTPLGCLLLLNAELGDLSGLHAVVVGRSNLVGKPMAQLLLQHNCSVATIHSKTRNPEEIAAQADILIIAVGHIGLVDEKWIKKGATVLDVGISRADTNKILGDVDFESVSKKAAAITPVPGGVGPMTVACLLYNTTIAMTKQLGLPLHHLKSYSARGTLCLS